MIGYKYIVLFNRVIITNYTDGVEVIERVMIMVGGRRSEFVILKDVILEMYLIKETLISLMMEFLDGSSGGDIIWVCNKNMLSCF